MSGEGWSREEMDNAARFGVCRACGWPRLEQVTTLIRSDGLEGGSLEIVCRNGCAQPLPETEAGADYTIDPDELYGGGATADAAVRQVWDANRELTLPTSEDLLDASRVKLDPMVPPGFLELRDASGRIVRRQPI